ncbi:hypothetical protein QTP88_017755 [Uroleucon formosanum]
MTCTYDHNYHNRRLSNLLGVSGTKDDDAKRAADEICSGTMVRGRVSNNGINEQRGRVPRYRIYYCRRRFFAKNVGSLLKWDSALGYSSSSESRVLTTIYGYNTCIIPLMCIH